MLESILWRLLVYGDRLDKLGMTADASGARTGELWYKPWGETRYSSGNTPTSFRYTSQREDATIGLYFYNARYYDPVLGRFVQADTIVPQPGNPGSLNRYSYTQNNPLRYTDPSGHFVEDDIPLLCPGCKTWEDVKRYYLKLYGDKIGAEAYSMLSNPLVTFGSIVFAGSGEYSFLLQGTYNGHEDTFSMVVWDMNKNTTVSLGNVLQNQQITVWSTNTEVKEGGYFYIGWDKGFASEVAAEQWRRPWQRGFGDFSVSSSERFTGYRVYTDWNGWFLTTLLATAVGGKPDNLAAFGALVVDVTDKGIDLANNAFIDRRYPLLYTGNEWLGQGPSFYSALRPPAR